MKRRDDIIYKPSSFASLSFLVIVESFKKYFKSGEDQKVLDRNLNPIPRGEKNLSKSEKINYR